MNTDKGPRQAPQDNTLSGWDNVVRQNASPTGPVTLTVSDLYKLCTIRDALGKKVRWLVNEAVASGVARNFTDVNGNFLTSAMDVRDGYLWISGTMEHFLPVRDVMAMASRGDFVVD